MKLIAKQNKFVEMVSTMHMNGLFNPIVMTVKKNIISMIGRDDADTVITVQKYKHIEIIDGTDEKIVIDPEEMLNAFKLFKSDDEITVTTLDDLITIANVDEAEINDVITIPRIDISTVDAAEFPYKIKSGLPIITNKATGEQVKFVINATIPVKYLTEFVKRANFTGINPRIYKLNIDENKLRGVVGESTKYQKSVTTTVNITGEGSGELIFGNGFEEMISTVSGDITINALPGAPAWITYKSSKNIVYVLIAPAIEIEE